MDIFGLKHLELLKYEWEVDETGIESLYKRYRPYRPQRALGALKWSALRPGWPQAGDFRPFLRVAEGHGSSESSMSHRSSGDRPHPLPLNLSAVNTEGEARSRDESVDAP